MFGLKFRSQIEGVIGSELESLSTGLRSYVLKEHDTEGSHTDVIADSVTLQNAPIGTWVDIAYTQARFITGSSAVWTVAQEDMLYLRASRMGQIVFVQFNLVNTALTVDTSDSLFITLPDYHAIPNLNGGSPAYQIGGVLNYTDADGNGIGPVFAQAQGFSGTKPSTILQLDKIGPVAGSFDAWAIGAITIVGSIWFACQPNNEPTPFYGN